MYATKAIFRSTVTQRKLRLVKPRLRPDDVDRCTPSTRFGFYLLRTSSCLYHDLESTRVSVKEKERRFVETPGSSSNELCHRDIPAYRDIQKKAITIVFGKHARHLRAHEHMKTMAEVGTPIDNTCTSYGTMMKFQRERKEGNEEKTAAEVGLFGGEVRALAKK